MTDPLAPLRALPRLRLAPIADILDNSPLHIPSVGVWAILGFKTRHLLASRARIRAFNLAMAVLLACSSLPVLLEGR